MSLIPVTILTILTILTGFLGSGKTTLLKSGYGRFPGQQGQAHL